MTHTDSEIIKFCKERIKEIEDDEYADAVEEIEKIIEFVELTPLQIQMKRASYEWYIHTGYITNKINGHYDKLGGGIIRRGVDRNAVCKWINETYNEEERNPFLRKFKETGACRLKVKDEEETYIYL